MIEEEKITGKISAIQRMHATTTRPGQNPMGGDGDVEVDGDVDVDDETDIDEDKR